LWARPQQLFPWSPRVEWLFSPVTGNDEWAGDLWGIDADGELIIVENKLSSLRTKLLSSNERFDPFLDFVEHWENWPRYKEKCSVSNIRGKWKSLLCEERKDPRRVEQRADEKKRGILPHSRKCDRLQRWKGLTTEVEDRIRSDDYENTVLSCLEQRQRHENPPHYCGLITRNEADTDSQNTEFCNASIRTMQEEGVRINHLHLFKACACVLSSDTLNISVVRVPIADIKKAREMEIRRREQALMGEVVSIEPLT
jgi:hypothetical protein